MTDRSIVDIHLPFSDATVHLYTYLTNRENREIRKVALSSAKIDVTGEVSTFPAEVTMLMEEAALKFLVKSITTKEGELTGEAVLTFLDEVHSADGDTLYAEINRIMKGSEHTPESKKK